MRLLKLLWWLVLASLLVGIVWLFRHDGTLTIRWFGLTIEAHPAFVLLGLFILWLALRAIVGMLRRVFGLPKGFLKRRRARKWQQAIDQLIAAQTAIILHQPNEALAQSTKAMKVLGDHPQLAPLAKLTHAQSLQASDDTRALKSSWEALLEDERTELAAMQGLLELAKREGNLARAVDLAERALKAHQSESVVIRTLLQLYKQAGQLDDALELVTRHRKQIPADKREEALLHALIADARYQGEARVTRLLDAHKSDKRSVPIALLLVRACETDSHKKQAGKVVETVWKTHPCTPLADDYLALFADEPFKKQQSRAKRLAGKAAHHPESKALLARISGDETPPENYHAGWQCNACLATQHDWQLVCTNCGHADSIQWQTLEEQDSPTAPVRTAITAALVCLVWAPLSFASPTSKVGGAKVVKDLTQLELRGGVLLDDTNTSNDNRWQMRWHVDHGFTDNYALRLIVAEDKRKGDSLEHDLVGMEHRFQFFNVADDGFDGGIRLTYAHKDNDKRPSTGGLRLMGVWPKGKWQLRHNSIIEHELGPNSTSGLSYEARIGVGYQLTPEHMLELDLFSDFGNLRELHGGWDDQSHEFGPAFIGDLPFDNMAYELGYRAGISEAALDHTFRLFFKYTL